MRYFTTSEDRRLLADDGDRTYDLTAVDAELAGFADLARTAHEDGASVDEAAGDLLTEAPTVDTDTLGELAVPVRAEEVWAAGVTYRISEQAREEESDMPDVYLRVYDAERPEIFLKATPSRTVGPGDAIGIRGDSDWNVPEPELGVVLYRGDIVGYTVGNDVSSREIEGENPLYLPQAKVYDRCCALGPCVSSPDTVGDAHGLEMSMQIDRGGETVYDAATSTGEMVRTCEELVSQLTRHNVIPETAVLLTGTSLVPDDEFTLREGDAVAIEIENVGVLENSVTTV